MYSREKGISKYLILAWLISVPFSYFGMGFLSNYYSRPYEFILSALIFNSGVILFLYLVLPMVNARLRSNPIDLGVGLSLFIVLFFFAWTMFNIVGLFPSLFEVTFCQLEAGQLIYFAIALVLSLPLVGRMLSFAGEKCLDQTHLYKCVDESLGGLVLAAFFFSIYLISVSIFNQPAFNSDDIFFDADSNLWRWRFATETFRDYYWRPVHPFVLVVIRPLVSLIGIFLGGDTLHATFVLVAFAGALCVFLVWYFVKQVIGNSLYALLIASLFGASAAQLVFSSLIETYIFLAAVALIFIVLLLKDKPLFALVITGLVVFGITISNFGQTVIAHLLIKRDIKQWIKYGLIVATLVIPLNMLNNFIYPNSQPYIFDLSTYSGEGHNSFPPTVQRGEYLARVMFLHSIVAPEPLILEEEIPFLKVWMFRASIKKDPMRIAQYETWFDTSVAFAWLAFILLGGVLFLKNLKKQDNRFLFTFILLLLFEFALHMQYGKDVFLYSANWTYAFILFLALAWREFANKKWFQISLLVFIALLLVNNSRLIFIMLSTSALHIN